MATLNIKALSAGISLFALFMVGTISAKANTHEEDKKEKEKKEVKAGSEKIETVANELWFEFTGGDPSSPSDYILHNDDGSESPSICQPEPTELVCAVKALPSASNPMQPDLSTVTETRYTPDN